MTVTGDISLGSIGTVIVILGVAWRASTKLAQIEMKVETMWKQYTYSTQHGRRVYDHKRIEDENN